ncbi:MAG: hypothetical protein JO115_20540 [Pseudonocardiales bacterium]|nr:hypothetical protein [Pseudonocardiales bacterium]
MRAKEREALLDKLRRIEQDYAGDDGFELFVRACRNRTAKFDPNLPVWSALKEEGLIVNCGPDGIPQIDEEIRDFVRHSGYVIAMPRRPNELGEYETGKHRLKPRE